jgi:tetratricopeptide (TPR) repeat protein
MALSELAWVYTKRGGFDRAVMLTREALEIARGCAYSLAEYRAVSVLGLTYLEGGDQSAAIERLDQALELARRLSLRRREGVELHNLGECYYFLQRYDEALARSRQALSIFLEIHDRGTEGDVRVNLGRTLHAQGNIGRAVEELATGLELAKAAGRTEYIGLAHLERGRMHTEAGRVGEATLELEHSHALFAAMDSLYLWRAELASAHLARVQGDRRAAAQHAGKAAALIEAQRDRMGTCMNDEGLLQALDEVHDVLRDSNA